ILPLTSLKLQYAGSNERVSSGIADLDEMLEGKGYFRGSSVLISGTSGSGKTTLASSFAEATCKSGERCLYIGFEESMKQVERNMKSVGMDLEPWSKKGLLFHEAWRPTQFGVEMHLLRIHKLIEKVKPSAVILDPVTNLISSSSDKEVYSMLMRLMDFLKGAKITAVFVSLTGGGDDFEKTEVGISSLTDTWLLLRDLELNGERNRVLYVLKSRGMAHSNQLREFMMSDRGIRLIPAYVGAGKVLTGSTRIAQEAKERADARAREQENQRKQQGMERKRLELQAQIAAFQAELAGIEADARGNVREGEEREKEVEADRSEMARSRGSS
ncbi:MAG: ATPase domain-containing protein, partial [Candidatus Acidiferrum sp.]